MVRLGTRGWKNRYFGVRLPAETVSWEEGISPTCWWGQCSAHGGQDACSPRLSGVRAPRPAEFLSRRVTVVPPSSSLMPGG